MLPFPNKRQSPPGLVDLFAMVEMFSEITIIIELKFWVVSFREVFTYRKGEGERETFPLSLRKWFGIQSCQRITPLAVKSSVRF